MNLAKSGKTVAVIERHQQVGGGCTHWGTIPSKALRHSVSRYIEYKENPLFQKPLPFYIKTEEGLASFLGDYISTTADISRKHHALNILRVT